METVGWALTLHHGVFTPCRSAVAMAESVSIRDKKIGNERRSAKLHA